MAHRIGWRSAAAGLELEVGQKSSPRVQTAAFDPERTFVPIPCWGHGLFPSADGYWPVSEHGGLS